MEVVSVVRKRADGAWLVSPQKISRRITGSRVRRGVVGELKSGKEAAPVVPRRPYIGSQGDLKSLVHNLGLAVRLRVIRRRQRARGVEEFADFVPKLPPPAGIPVGDYLLGDAVLADDVLEEQSRGFDLGDAGAARYEESVLGELVHNDEYVVKPVGQWQLRDEVHCDDFKRSRWDWVGSE